MGLFLHKYGTFGSTIIKWIMCSLREKCIIDKVDPMVLRPLGGLGSLQEPLRGHSMAQGAKEVIYENKQLYDSKAIGCPLCT